MSTPQKRKGSEAERQVAKYLQKQGWKHAERRVAGATLDKGDIYGILGCVVEVKNQKRTDLAGWVEELKVEMINAKSDMGVVVHKRPRTTDVGEWYATVPMSLFVELLKKAGFQ